MKIPTVSSCCCFDLRTAGLILGTLGVVFILVAIFDEAAWYMRVYLSIVLIFELLFIGGILRETPNLMLPTLIVSLIEPIVLLFSPFFLPFLTKYFIPELYEMLQKSGDHYTATYVAICVMLYIIIGFSVYFTIVCYSLYKQIKDKVSTTQNAANSMRFDV